MKVAFFDLDDTLFDTTGQLNGSYENLDRITPFPDTVHVLKTDGFSKILVTRGNPSIQQRKIDVLGIRGLLTGVYVTPSDEGKKEVFERVVQQHALLPENAFVIGDRIDSEIKFGNELGLVTIRFLGSGKYSSLVPSGKYETPAHTVKSLREVLAIIKP